MNSNPKPKPKAYLITFTTYGSWLHGDSRGSVHRRPARGKRGKTGALPRLYNYQGRNLSQAPIVLNAEQRAVVREAIVEECVFRNWRLLAETVRVQHCHAAIEGDAQPERMMQNIKATATRKLRERGLFGQTQRVWARHGSTRYLWTNDAVTMACDYVKSHG
jgi:REP element-mobilizing transposase RayT